MTGKDKGSSSKADAAKAAEKAADAKVDATDAKVDAKAADAKAADAKADATDATDAKPADAKKAAPKAKPKVAPVAAPTPGPVVVGETFGAGTSIQLTPEQFDTIKASMAEQFGSATVEAFVARAGEAVREIMEPLCAELRDSVSSVRDAMHQLQVDMNMLKMGSVREGAAREKPAAVKTSAPKAPSNAKILFKQEYKATPEVRRDHQKKYEPQIKEWRGGKGKEWLDKDKNQDGSPDYFGKEAELVWEKLTAEDKKVWQDKHKAQAKTGAPVENAEE